MPRRFERSRQYPARNNARNGLDDAPKTAEKTSFESLIVEPIFNLDSSFLTDPRRRDEAPLLEKEPPPAIETSTSFDSLGDYLDTMRHALLHESHHSLVHDYDNLDERGLTIPLEVIDVKSGGREIKCSVDFDTLDGISQSLNAMIGTKVGMKADYLIAENSVGKIMDIFSTDSRDTVIASITHKRGNGRQRTFGLDLLLTTPLPSATKTIEFLHFSSFSTARRQFDALAKINVSSFRNVILDPRSSFLQEISEHDQEQFQYGMAILEAPLNPSQRRAVVTAAAMIVRPCLWMPWMTLVQGPPGTGKSQTVLALIELLVKMDSSFHRGPIVVCTPSNAAVDQLLCRVIRTEWAAPLIDGGKSRRLFRIGVESKMAPEARRFSPTELNPVDAGVIFTTLNSAGSYQLEDLPKPAVVIIDEAGQSTELDFWIPIVMHKANKVVVIGDPLQLSPTVLSEEAGRHGLKRSFMERFYRRLKVDEQLDRMLRLNVQYRMHPNICQFPSRRFYDDSLETAAQVFRRETDDVFPFPAYQVADVDQSTDSVARRGSRCNEKEADEIVKLIVEMLQVTSDYSIAVATPYVAQVSLIARSLKYVRVTEDGVMKKGTTVLGAIKRPNYCGDRKSDRGEVDENLPTLMGAMSLASEKSEKSLKSPIAIEEESSTNGKVDGGTTNGVVESKRESELRELPFTSRGNSLHAYVDVKTVDAFQGDERDVVIFSCVRASPDYLTRGIGFVADRQRMNVALTRARRSLYVVGNFRSLCVNADWKALYQDAVDRELFRKKDLNNNFCSLG